MYYGFLRGLICLSSDYLHAVCMLGVYEVHASCNATLHIQIGMLCPYFVRGFSTGTKFSVGDPPS